MTKTSVAIWLHSPSSESTWFSILVWLDGAGIIGRVGLGMKFRMEVRFCKNQLTYEKAIMNSPDNGVHECQSRIPKKHGLHRDSSFRNMAGIARVCQVETSENGVISNR